MLHVIPSTHNELGVQELDEVDDADTDDVILVIVVTTSRMSMLIVGKDVVLVGRFEVDDLRATSPSTASNNWMFR